MRSPRTMIVAALSFAAVAAVGPSIPLPVAAQVQPTVSVAADPAVAQLTDRSSCGESPLVESAAIVFTRDDATDGVKVEYTLGGDAVFGTDFFSDQLRLGSVDILAGETSATVEIEPLEGVRPNRVLTLTIDPSSDYQVGDPASASVQFLVAVADCAAPPPVPVPLAPTFTG